jgi:DNA-dependent metalloprotease WSS1
MNSLTFGNQSLGNEFDKSRSMTHGPLFWKTYNILKKEMSELDAKGYTGEGFYSRPYSLNATVPFSRPIQENEIPENICGGTWQRTKRRGRRKTGGRKRKFEGEGVKIGEDENRRRQLEHGKKVNASKVIRLLKFDVKFG